MKTGKHALPSIPILSFRSLRAKVTISVILPLVLIFGVFMYGQYQTQQREVLNSLALLASQTGVTIQNSLEIAMLNHNQEELQHILDSIGKNQILRIVYLLDTSGQVIFAPEGQGVGTKLDNHDVTCQPCHHLPPAQRPTSVVVTLANGESVFRTMNPIVNLPKCQACHDPSQHLNGVLLTDISMAPLEATLNKELWQHILWWLAAILCSVIIVNLVINRFVLRRLQTVANAIRELGHGERSNPLPEGQDDEIGQLSNTFNEMARQIEKRDTENQQLSEDLRRQYAERGELLKRLITVQEDERARVARDLHDELGQALAGLSLRTEAVKSLVSSNPEKALNVLDQTQNLLRTTSEQMYNMILALRPSVLDDLGLVAALRAHAERIFKDANVKFRLETNQLPQRLPAEMETTLYRIFQEALNNVVRHANASEVSMSLSINEDQDFCGEVVDNGEGFDVDEVRSYKDKPQGLGLLGMQERVNQYHGKIEVSSSVERGTRICIRIPLKEVKFD